MRSEYTDDRGGSAYWRRKFHRQCGVCQGIRFFEGPSNKVTFTPRVGELEKGVFAEGANWGRPTRMGPTGSAEKNLPTIGIHCFGRTDPEVPWHLHSAPAIYTKAL